MPRAMPALAKHFQTACDTACRLAVAGELVRASGGVVARQEFTLPRLEYLYEIAFLRIFIAWEFFLEESFLRYMCGFHNSKGFSSFNVLAVHHIQEHFGGTRCALRR